METIKISKKSKKSRPVDLASNKIEPRFSCPHPPHHVTSYDSNVILDLKFHINEGVSMTFYLGVK